MILDLLMGIFIMTPVPIWMRCIQCRLYNSHPWEFVNAWYRAEALPAEVRSSGWHPCIENLKHHHSLLLCLQGQQVHSKESFLWECWLNSHIHTQKEQQQTGASCLQKRCSCIVEALLQATDGMYYYQKRSADRLMAYTCSFELRKDSWSCWQNAPKEGWAGNKNA